MKNGTVQGKRDLGRVYIGNEVMVTEVTSAMTLFYLGRRISFKILVMKIMPSS